MRHQLPLSLALACLAALGAPGARAELPPWVYGEQQRQAPVVLHLAVSTATRGASDRQLRCRVLQVIRQPPIGQLRPGQTVLISTPTPKSRGPAMVGPSPLPVVQPGDRVTAWLTPVPGQMASFTPAAGGRSFGPSMEDVFEPGSPRYDR